MKKVMRRPIGKICWSTDYKKLVRLHIEKKSTYWENFLRPSIGNSGASTFLGKICALTHRKKLCVHLLDKTMRAPKRNSSTSTHWKKLCVKLMEKFGVHRLEKVERPYIGKKFSFHLFEKVMRSPFEKDVRSPFGKKLCFFLFGSRSAIQEELVQRLSY